VWHRLLCPQAEYGEHLKIVGNLPQLGSWNVEDAAPMQWKDNHIWETDVELPLGREAQFKAVLLSHNATVWEPGPDRLPPPPPFPAWFIHQ